MSETDGLFDDIQNSLNEASSRLDYLIIYLKDRNPYLDNTFIFFVEHFKYEESIKNLNQEELELVINLTKTGSFDLSNMLIAKQIIESKNGHKEEA